jgi:hypothetical protein
MRGLRANKPIPKRSEARERSIGETEGSKTLDLNTPNREEPLFAKRLISLDHRTMDRKPMGLP